MLPVGTPLDRWIDRPGKTNLLTILMWLVCVAIWLIQYRNEFGTLAFRDPDDAMRLVQVRDFLTGQSWFDVSQHRVNPPFGGPMHWSRLVDLPIAAMILLFRPLVGAPMAEIIACVSVPMLTMGILCAIFRNGVRALLGNGVSVFAVALLLTSFSILTQAPPLRIDHHAWQIVMAAVTMGGVLARDPRRGGMIAASGMMMWAHISSEALPYAVLTGAVIGLRYMQEAREWPRLFSYVAVLAFGSGCLLLATHGWSGSLVSYCDAMSPVYLIPLATIAPMMWIIRKSLGDTTPLRRAITPALAGASGAALFLSTGGQCLAGPFQTMGPLVFRFWYQGILEGLPIWQQDRLMQAMILLPALAGIAGILAALHREDHPGCKAGWQSLLLLSLGGLAVSIYVMRSMAFAHLFALPGLAWLIATLFARSQKLTVMPLRVVCAIPLCALSPAGLVATAAIFVSQPVTPNAKAAKAHCSAPQELAALGAMPATTFFAPIDVGPDILAKTGHSVIATSHHRNVRGLSTVIRAFLADPASAQSIVGETQARYLLTCPSLDETGHYMRAQPHGLMAQLVAGHTPHWLEPVHLPGASAIHIYRIADIPPR